ncbi:MAG: autotransporter-associated beta strand repeat-containing protein, partial [Opitutaceae bacterium]|nr:autotransporter-associated beta strand repeat-containing protein [Opitutaceae bacterium]
MKIPNFFSLSLLTALSVTLPAQQFPPVTDTTFSADTIFDGMGTTHLRQQNSGNITWLIADDVTVTVKNSYLDGGTNSVAGGMLRLANNTTFRIDPLDTNGRIIFDNNMAPGWAGVIYVGSNAKLYITNAEFLGNYSTLRNDGGGALGGDTNSYIELVNTYFEGNNARAGGAISAYGELRMTSGTFVDNYTIRVNVASLGYGGAIRLGNGSGAPRSVIRDVAFSRNVGVKGGGALAVQGNHSAELTDATAFTNNAAGLGGAIYNDVDASVANVTGIMLRYTGTSGVTNFSYIGNVAKGAFVTTDADLAAMLTGTMPFTPTAKGGGFYFSNAVNSKLQFDIADGVTVTIGNAGNPTAWDSFATADASGTKALLELTGTGASAGTLILHAGNSYFQGTVNVGAGSLILGNQNASLGGAITVASGATLGGSGTLVTHKQNDSVFAGRTSLTLATGARLAPGTDTAADAETLHVLGGVTASAGAIFSHDLFDSGSASRLLADSIDLTGAATVNLGLLATGSFVLMEWTGAGLDAADLGNLSLTVDGAVNNSRSIAALSLSGNQLVVTNTVNNLVMRWTGSEGSRWMRRPSIAQKNWADAGGSAENRFFNADTVVFDGTADAASPGNRDITIEAGGVVVSGMEVSGTARYVFRGEGGIEADAGVVGSASFAPTGKLIKSGVGELVFANTAPNIFQGGIEIAGGVIAFDHAAQLGSGTGGLMFTDSATLRAAGMITGTLTGGVGIAAGRTAGLEVEPGGALVYGGTLVAGGTDSVWRKTGAGSLLIAGDNSGNIGAVAVDTGAVTLVESAAALGGKITVNAGAALGGVGAAGNGGSVQIASGGILEAGVDTAQSGTLTVYNLELTGGAVLKFDLFKEADGAYRKSDRIYDAGASAISGSNIIDLTSFASGTFNLGNLAAVAAGGRVTLSGMTLPTGGRLSAELSGTGGVLELVMVADQSRVMTWTGSGGSTWNLANTNWTDNGAVNQYSYGDRVLFAGATDQSILIDAGEVRIADMAVGGDADYAFTGGGIHASADNVQDDGAGAFNFTDATGKLTKTGNGVLTFANGKNTFRGGIDLAGGVIAISNGNQLTTSASTGITFTGNAVLRATADLTLDDDLTIDTGKTGVVDSGDHTMTLKGTISGTTDATFAKDGAGTLLLDTALSDFSGTLTVLAGTLRAGAADSLTNGNQAAIVVNAGATLDIDGNNQSLTNLTGAGEIALGSAELTYTVADTSDWETFAGSFTGSGSVIKTGDGKWTLSGSSSHTGGTILHAGELGLASNNALGTGALKIESPTAKLHIDANGLLIPNDISSSAATLTVETNGHDAELSGKITASSVVLDGTGTLALSGNNTYNSLTVNIPLAIARRAESISGAVHIGNGSTLEFRDISSGQVLSNIAGDRVLFTSSTLSLLGANNLRALDITAGSRVTSVSTGALGGVGANITVRDGAWLTISNPGTTGGNMNVDGGTIVFSAPWKMSSLALSGTLAFTNGGEIRLDGILPTGIYTTAIAYGGITNLPDYDPHQGSMLIVADIVHGDTLVITAYNKALEPGKDIAVGFDAMRASASAIRSHVDEHFIVPLTGGGADSSSENSLWFRALASFAEHEASLGYLGYSENTYAGILGYDWISTGRLMLGGYAGFFSTELE